MPWRQIAAATALSGILYFIFVAGGLGVVEGQGELAQERQRSGQLGRGKSKIVLDLHSILLFYHGTGDFGRVCAKVALWGKVNSDLSGRRGNREQGTGMAAANISILYEL